MIRSQLNSYSGSDPIWGFVALLGNERFTGEAAVGLDPRVRLFAVDGRVYFAEREGDAPVSTRLVNCGAVTATQLEHGGVRIGDTTSLARLFQREPGIDRDAVELTIESATEALLESIATKPVGLPEVFPLRHHPSGIHHWLRNAHQPAPAVVLVAAEPSGVDRPAATEPTVEAEQTVEAEPIVEVALAAPVLHEWPAASLVPQASASPVEPPPVVVEEPTFVVAAMPLEEEPAAFVEPTPVPHANGFAALPTLGSLSSHEATTPERLHDALTASQPAHADPEPTSTPEPQAMPTLSSLTSLTSLTSQLQPSASDPAPAASTSATAFFGALDGNSAVGGDTTAIASAYPTFEPERVTTELPKLASAPMSMDELAAIDNAAKNSPTTGQWNGASHNPAVEIWEMIDNLDGSTTSNDQLVTTGTEKRSRGWLRGRKG